MSIEPDKLLGASLPTQRRAWTAKDVMLYALGLGVGDLGIGERELRRLYEKDLEVLPTFGALSALLPDPSAVAALPGAGFDPAGILHAAHEVEFFRTVPAAADDVVTTSTVVGVHDKGSAAIVLFEARTTWRDEPLLNSRITIFVRGAGGFGGSHGMLSPAAPAVATGDPDDVIDVVVRPNQSALYRLSGDLNALHIDPAAAEAVGFPRPIVHGMYSLGVATTAVIDTALGGDTAAVHRLSTRFAGTAVPGETLRVRVWRNNDGASFDVVVPSRDDAPVLVGGTVTRTPRWVATS